MGPLGFGPINLMKGVFFSPQETPFILGQIDVHFFAPTTQKNGNPFHMQPTDLPHPKTTQTVTTNPIYPCSFGHLYMDPIPAITQKQTNNCPKPQPVSTSLNGPVLIFRSGIQHGQRGFLYGS